MKNKYLTIKLSLVAASILSLNVSATEHTEMGNDYIFSAQELSKLANIKQPLLSDDQFVFNNELALLDWDSVFASYFPHLKPYQETIMHYAGYYSINPKLLIALIEYKSLLVSNPSEKGYLMPFADLSDESGFQAQIKDVSSKLSKRFYAYKKLSLHPKKENFVLRSYKMPSTAATMAFASVLSRESQFKAAQKNPYKEMTNKSSNTGDNFHQVNASPIVNGILDAYETVFAQNSDILKNKDESSLEGKEALQESSSIKTPASAAANYPNLYLPWSSGWSWVAGGAHGFDGGSWPLSSLDFYYPGGNTGWGGNKPYVYASHGGTVTWYSRCNMRITHASGLATNYYHMDNLQYGSGSYINAGTYIGTYANNKSAALCEGGQSTGPHLHISLLKNGYYESLQGYNFSGYYIQVGTSQYDSNCSRNYFWKNGYTYCAGNNIYKPYE
ncbi:elastinolytic metalloprotease LasA [Colwellia sp. KU-HH00111]|uniref:M23 family metallopeptidase n=1 Tax=Colwellia sp. KU-HH00111 TaxID=3127652 RepID=UPI0031054A4B